VEIVGFELEFNHLNTGFLIGMISSILIFYIEIPTARNFLGLLIGAGFSHVFTTERDDSNRYFFLSGVFIIFTLMELAGFRWPLIIAFFVLAISAHGEFESRAMVEKIRSEEAEN
jgi:hypothetical protein